MIGIKTRQLTFAGVFASLIFIVTRVIHVPIGAAGGYIHVGDAFIYLAACLLPIPLSYWAAAIGAGLSDLFTPGAAVWILPTVIIKPLCCLAFTNSGRLIQKRNVAALLVAAAITAAGYGAAAAVITGSIAIAIAELPFSLLQSSASAVCFLVLAAALDKTGIRLMLAGKTQ
ncbi:MAG: TIGR04002 family protein [Oscillospiraceae bacterium]|nr:TIGR04002 family protein [Oscillospiraceae bacterium]